MANTLTDITQAVVDYLNPLGMGFTAERVWVVPIEYADNDDIRVIVAPRPEIGHEERSRGSNFDIVTVLVVVTQRVDQFDIDAIDELADLTAEIKQALTAMRTELGTWAGAASNPAFDREMLLKNRYAGIVTVDFKVVK